MFSVAEGTVLISFPKSSFKKGFKKLVFNKKTSTNSSQHSVKTSLFLAEQKKFCITLKMCLRRGKILEPCSIATNNTLTAKNLRKESLVFHCKCVDKELKIQTT